MLVQYHPGRRSPQAVVAREAIDVATAPFWDELIEIPVNTALCCILLVYCTAVSHM